MSLLTRLKQIYSEQESMGGRITREKSKKTKKTKQQKPLKVKEVKSIEAMKKIEMAKKGTKAKGLSYRDYVKMYGIPKKGEWQKYKAMKEEKKAKQKVEKKYTSKPCPPGLSYREFVKMCGGVPKAGEWERYKSGIPPPPTDPLPVPFVLPPPPKGPLPRFIPSPPKGPLPKLPWEMAPEAEELPMPPSEWIEELPFFEEEIELYDIPYYGEGLVGGQIDNYINMCRKATKQDLETLLRNYGSPIAPPPPPMEEEMPIPRKQYKIEKQPKAETQIQLVSEETQARNALMSELQQRLAGRKAELEGQGFKRTSRQVKKIQKQMKELDDLMRATKSIIQSLQGGRMARNAPKPKPKPQPQSQPKTVKKMKKSAPKKRGRPPMKASQRKRKNCPKGLTYRDFVKQCGGIPPKGAWEQYKMGSGLAGGCINCMNGGCMGCMGMCPY